MVGARCVGTSLIWFILVAAVGMLACREGGAALQSPTRPKRSLQQLLAQIDNLSHEELDEFQVYGNSAWRALYLMTRQSLLQFRAERLSSQAAEFPQPGDRYVKAVEALRRLMKPSHTWDAMRLLELSREIPDWEDPIHSSLFALLTGDNYFREPKTLGGNPNQVAPLCVAELRRPHPPDEVGVYGNSLDQRAVCLRYVARSSHPVAVRYMLSRLRDPSADISTRHEAYLHLAGTGGKVGLREVLARRHTERTVPPLRVLMELDQVGTDVEETKRRLGWSPPLLETGRDSQGTLWGWFASGIIGSGQDRWLARREGNRWSDPIFAVCAFNGREIRDWLQCYPQRAKELARDTDGDGWADNVEERIGSDPRKVDTDGDGLRDSEDRNPLAAPRPLSDQEQIFAAAFEAQFHFSGNWHPCRVHLPPGIGPLELAGWEGIIVATRDDPGSKFVLRPPDPRRIGGLAWVSFSLTSPNTSEQVQFRKRPTRTASVCERKKAEFEIGINNGPLSSESFVGKARKFGSDWVVVGADLVAVS